MSNLSPDVSSQTSYAQTETRWIDVGGTAFAYRDFGSRNGTPLVLLNRWGAVLDDFNSTIVQGLARFHRVVALDYRGVGASGGIARVSVDKMADDAILLIRAMGFDRVDLLGFSLGGFVAQDIALKTPTLARRLVLSDTAPAGGQGSDRVGAISWPLILKGFLALRDPTPQLFSPANGRQAASVFLRRLKERKTGLDKEPRPRAIFRQIKAMKAWGQQASQDLSRLRMPVLIVKCENDILVPIALSYEMARRIPHAQLISCRDVGHGSPIQHHEYFVRKTLAFLGS